MSNLSDNMASRDHAPAAGFALETAHTPGPWRWQGEDYRGGWGWQMLVGPNGEGLIVGEGHDGSPYDRLRAHVPLDPALCVTGLAADGADCANAVHVFSEANARLIAAAPDLLEALRVFVSKYVEMAESGDCGFWNAEEEEHVISARAAIAKATGTESGADGDAVPGERSSTEGMTP